MGAGATLGLVVGAVLIGGCFQPHVENGGFSCDPDDQPPCPSNFYCINGRCIDSPIGDVGDDGGVGGVADDSGAGSVGDDDLGAGHDLANAAHDLGHPPKDLTAPPPDQTPPPPPPPDFSVPPDLATGMCGVAGTR